MVWLAPKETVLSNRQQKTRVGIVLYPLVLKINSLLYALLYPLVLKINSLL